MAVELSELFPNGPIAEVQTSIGTLAIFSARLGDQMAVAESLKKSISEVSPKEFSCHFFRQICFPKQNQTENFERPDKPTLSVGEIEDLPSEELNTLAQSYLDKNRYLYLKVEHKPVDDTEGKRKVTITEGDIEHPRKENESAVEYLHRLCSIKEERRKMMDKMLKPFSNLNSFSTNLTSSIEKNLRLGESITKAIRPFGFRENLDFQSQFPSEQKFEDMASLHRDLEASKERRRREPFNELAVRLDSLLDSSNQASQFMVEANKIQTEIAAEIKAGGDSTDKHARKNIKLSYLVIAITLFGLIYSIWAGIAASNQSEDQAKEFGGKADSLTAEISSQTQLLQTSLTENRNFQDEYLRLLGDLHQNTTLQNELLKSYESDIERLKADKDLYEMKINMLVERLELLENRGKEQGSDPKLLDGITPEGENR